MNWIGGARSRIRANSKSHKKIQKEYFERKRWDSMAKTMRNPIPGRERNQGVKKGFSQDLAFVQKGSRLTQDPNLMSRSGCYRMVNLSHNPLKGKIAPRAKGKKLQHVDLPLSPIETPSALQLSSSPASQENQGLSKMPTLRSSASYDFKYQKNVPPYLRERRSSNFPHELHTQPSTSIKPSSLPSLFSSAPNHHSGVIDLFGIEISKPEPTQAMHKYDIGISGDIAYKSASRSKGVAYSKEQDPRTSTSINSDENINSCVESQNDEFPRNFPVGNDHLLTSSNRFHPQPRIESSESGVIYESEDNNRVFSITDPFCVAERGNPGAFPDIDLGLDRSKSISVVGNHDNWMCLNDTRGRLSAGKLSSSETCESAISVHEEIDTGADFLEACSPYDIFNRRRQQHTKPSNTLESFQASCVVEMPQSFISMTDLAKGQPRNGYANKTPRRKEVNFSRSLADCTEYGNQKGHRLGETVRTDRRNNKTGARSKDMQNVYKYMRSRKSLDRKCGSMIVHDCMIKGCDEKLPTSCEDQQPTRNTKRIGTTTNASGFNPEYIPTDVLEEKEHYLGERYQSQGYHIPQGVGTIQENIRSDYSLPQKRHRDAVSQRSRAVDQGGPQGELVEIRYVYRNDWPHEEDPLGPKPICDDGDKFTPEKKSCTDRNSATRNDGNTCIDQSTMMHGNIATDMIQVPVQGGGLGEANSTRLSMKDTNVILQKSTECPHNSKTPQTTVRTTNGSIMTVGDKVTSDHLVNLEGKEAIAPDPESLTSKQLSDRDAAPCNIDSLTRETEQIMSQNPFSKTPKEHNLSNNENLHSSKLNVQEPFVDSSEKHDLCTSGGDDKTGMETTKTTFINGNSPNPEITTNNNVRPNDNIEDSKAKPPTDIVILKKVTPEFPSPSLGTFETGPLNGTLTMIPNSGVDGNCDGNCVKSQIDQRGSQSFDPLNENNQISTSYPQKMKNTLSVGTQTESKTYSDMMCSPIPALGDHTGSNFIPKILPSTETIRRSSLRNKPLVVYQFQSHLMLGQNEP